MASCINPYPGILGRVPGLVKGPKMVLLPGRERTIAEFAALLESAGLKLDRAVPTASPMVLLEASAR